MYSSSPQLRRTLLITFIVILLLVIAGFFGYRYVIMPRISVSAPVGSHLSITRTSDNATVANQTSTAATTTFWAGNGGYKVLMTQGSAKQVTYVTLAAFQEKKLTFAPPSQASGQRVTQQSAYDVLPADGGLTYYNPLQRSIQQFANGQTTVVQATAPQAMGLISKSQAIVEYNKAFYVLSNQQLTPISTVGLPPVSEWRTVILGSSPAQDSFVIAINQTLYWYKDTTAAPQKITTLTKAFDQIAVGGDRAIAYSTRMPTATSDISAHYTNFQIDPLLVDLKTKSEQTLTTGPLADATISPAGTYATISKELGSRTTIYDLTTRAALNDVANSRGFSPLWTDDTHYLFGDTDSTIWSMDVPGASAHTIGRIGTGQQITSLTVGTTPGSYYATVYNSQTDASIYSLTTGESR